MNSRPADSDSLVPLPMQWMRSLARGSIVRLRCAWCGLEPAANAELPRDAAVSHGICRPCAQRHFGIDPVLAIDR
jgi:hypothetical protein